MLPRFLSFRACICDRLQVDIETPMGSKTQTKQAISWYRKPRFLILRSQVRILAGGAVI